MNIEIQENTRAKRVRIVVHEDGRVVVTKPARVGTREVERFVASRKAWIEKVQAQFERRNKKLEKLGGRVDMPRLRRGTAAYRAAVAAARKVAAERLSHYSRLYGIRYAGITIRNQKTRWGSASRRGMISINYRITYLSSDLRDYIVVHELCHLAELNHSKRFWALVSEAIPDWKQCRAALRRYRF